MRLRLLIDQQTGVGPEHSGDRARLTSAENFRSEIARDRALERAWYNFRNDRAIAAMEQWLREIGVK